MNSNRTSQESLAKSRKIEKSQRNRHFYRYNSPCRGLSPGSPCRGSPGVVCWGTAAMCAGVPEPGPLYCPIDDTSTPIHSQIPANYQQIQVGPGKSLATPGKLLGSFQISPDYSRPFQILPRFIAKVVPDRSRFRTGES